MFSDYNNIMLINYVIMYTIYTENCRQTIQMKSNALLLHLSAKLI